VNVTKLDTLPVVAVCDALGENGDSVATALIRELLGGAAIVEYQGDLRPLGADIVVLDNVDRARHEAVERALVSIRAASPAAVVVRVSSAPRLEPGPFLMDTAVLVVEDGATVTDGHTRLGPGTLAAVDAEVGMRVDPRPFAVGSLVETYRRYPQVGAVIPVMAYDAERLAEVEATIEAVECDAVVDGTHIDLAQAIRTRHPVRRVVRGLHELSAPTLADTLLRRRAPTRA
jgi:predicted GTPase